MEATRLAATAAGVALLLAAAAPASAVWKVGTATDPETLEALAAAVVESAGGAVLAVCREASGQRVQGILHLGLRDADFLDDGRAPLLYIDDGPPQQVPRLSGELKSVAFLLWGGEGEPTIGPLRDLMEGKKIVVEYPLNGGGFKDAVFDLVAARETIAEVLGVAAEVDPTQRDLALAREEALGRCLDLTKKKQQQKCFEALSACSSSATSAELRACLAGAG